MNTNYTARCAVDILREARKRIEEFDDEYICIAISNADGYSDLSGRLRDRVESVLDGHFTMEGWAQTNGLPTDAMYMRTMRLAWLDKWIAGIEEEHGLVDTTTK